MALDAYQSAQYARDRILVWQDLTVASATDAQKANAIVILNEAYREVLRGYFQDEEGLVRQHIWSFLTVTDAASMSFDKTTNPYTADLPADFDGMVDAPQFPYSATDPGPGLALKWVSPQELLRLRRDSTDAGTPQFYTFRPKTFAAASGTTWEMCVHPPTDTTVIFVLVYRALAALLTDSTAIFMRGPSGFIDLAVQCAKAREELWRGQNLGPEVRKYYEMMRQFVRMDEQLFGGDGDTITSFSQVDSGLSA